MPYTYDDYQRAADAVRQKLPQTPTIAMVLGSGLGPLADRIEDATIIPYEDIPRFPQSTVHGHAGRLVVGWLEGQYILVMQGRVHFYEGFEMDALGFPIRMMQLLGIKTLIVTNAAGGLNTSFSQGDLMLIKDHINLTGIAGHNPLMGPNDERLGQRFTPLTTPYDTDLRAIARQVATDQNITLQEGVYVSLAGPAFETPAEIRMLRTIGGDAVGMSTAPEVLVARHAEMRVLGISSITNIAIDDPDTDLDVSHEEVLEVGKTIVPRLMQLLRGILRQLPNS